MRCPKCNATLTRWEPRPRGRQAGYCGCNPQGPVITAPAGAWPDPLLEIPGIDAAIVAALHARGLGDLAALRAAPNRELLAVPGLGPARLGRIKEYLQEVEHDARI